MEDLLIHPAIQGGIAPFLAGLAVAALFAPVRLAGLAGDTGPDTLRAHEALPR